MIKPEPEFKARHGARLPHWTLEGGVYAVTFRLADSLPKSVLEAWEFERQDMIKTARQMKRPLTLRERTRLHTLFSEKVDRHLDAGQGKCWLREEAAARIVVGALRFFQKTRYRLFAWCVMPNHVHVVLEPLPGYELPEILHSWKSYTAKEINKRLGSGGKFWEVEYYDHLVRDERDFAAQVEYIRTNPQRAGLTDWEWIEVARASRP